jgi:hypothetical protein
MKMVFSGQFKGKYRNCGQVGHKLLQFKTTGLAVVKIRATQVVEFFVCIVASLATIRRTVSSSR